MRWLLVPLALLAGVGLPVQIAVNSHLRGFVGSAVVAAAISFAVGTILLAVVAVAGREPFSGHVWNGPWWIWTGGLIGAFYVFASIVLLPRLGAAVTVALVLAGQVAGALVIDQFGLLHVPKHAITPGRAVGALLIAGGVALVQSF